jgi:trigger factor
MQVSVETTGDLGRRMRIQVPSDDVDQEVESRLRSYGRSAKLKGFRPGKVPMKVIRKQYGTQIRAEVVNDVMRSSFAQAVSQEQLRPAGTPSIEPEANEQGQDLAYVATFEVYPEIELHGLDALAVEKLVAEVSDEDVDRVLENLREQRAEWNEVDRAAEDGDRMAVDFQGRLDGEPVEGTQGIEHSFVLGEGHMLEDFERGLRGASAGEERTFDVSFPEDYRAEDLAGKTLQFETKVHRVEAKSLPEIDDDFCASYGIAEGGVERLREDVRGNMQREAERKQRADLKNKLLDALALANPIEVPHALVHDEIHRLQDDIRQRHGVPEDQLPGHDVLAPQAKRRVVLGLLVNEVITSQQLQAEPERVESRLQELAAEYPDADQVVRASRANADIMRSIESWALEEQVTDWLLERATVNERSVSFNELIQS